MDTEKNMINSLVSIIWFFPLYLVYSLKQYFENNNIVNVIRIDIYEIFVKVPDTHTYVSIRI